MSWNLKSTERGRSFEIPNSELFKKVEEIEKRIEKVDKVEKSVDKVEKSVIEIMKMLESDKHYVCGGRECCGCQIWGC